MAPPHHAKSVRKANLRTYQSRTAAYPTTLAIESAWNPVAPVGATGTTPTQSGSSACVAPKNSTDPNSTKGVEGTRRRVAVAAVHQGAKIEVKPLTSLPERKEDETFQQWEFRVDESRWKNCITQHYRAARIREGLDPEDGKDKQLAKERLMEAAWRAEMERWRAAKQERVRKAEERTQALVAEHIRQKHARLALEREAERSHREALRLEREVACLEERTYRATAARLAATLPEHLRKDAGSKVTAVHWDSQINREEVNRRILADRMADSEGMGVSQMVVVAALAVAVSFWLW